MPSTTFADDYDDYYESKDSDKNKEKRVSVDDLIEALDTATSNALNNGGSRLAVDDAFEKVLNHPDSTWSREVLAYRQRQIYYK